jgi:hypothetical protein
MAQPKRSRQQNVLVTFAIGGGRRSEGDKPLLFMEQIIQNSPVDSAIIILLNLISIILDFLIYSTSY